MTNFGFWGEPSITKKTGWLTKKSVTKTVSLSPKWSKLIEKYNPRLSPDDFGREFSTGRKKFCVAGIYPRRPKHPISATRIPDGKGYKSTAENVVLLLQAAMKDVSPKA